MKEGVDEDISQVMCVCTQARDVRGIIRWISDALPPLGLALPSGAWLGSGAGSGLWIWPWGAWVRGLRGCRV